MLTVVAHSAPSDAGRAAALKAAFDEHYLSLLRLASLLAGSRHLAEDLVQEAFVRVAPRIETLDTQLVGAYMRRTVVNLWRSHLRRARLRRLLAARIEARAEGLVATPAVEPMWDVVARLPDRQRACIVIDGRLRNVQVTQSAVWVLDTGPLHGSLVRMDPSTRTVMARIPLGNSPAGLVATGSAAWTSGSDGLIRVDAATNTRTDLGAKGPSGTPLAAEDTRVWFAPPVSITNG